MYNVGMHKLKETSGLEMYTLKLKEQINIS